MLACLECSLYLRSVFHTRFDGQYFSKTFLLWTRSSSNAEAFLKYILNRISLHKQFLCLARRNYSVKPRWGRDRCPLAVLGLDNLPAESTISRSSSKSNLGGVALQGRCALFRFNGGKVRGRLLNSNILLLSSEKLDILLCRVGGGDEERSEVLVQELESSKLDPSLVSLFCRLKPNSIRFWTL